MMDGNLLPDGALGAFQRDSECLAVEVVVLPPAVWLLLPVDGVGAETEGHELDEGEADE